MNNATPRETPLDGQLQRQSTPFLVLQFFVFPMAIVAVCVLVFVVFGMIASEGRGARGYLAEVRTGTANRRWQAAFELSKVLQARKDPALSDPRFVQEITAVFEESGAEDPRVRRYLALALGRLGDRRAVPALLAALKEAEAGDTSRADPATQVYAVWALGTIGDALAVPELLRLARSEDPGLRKTAIHALGGFGGEEVAMALNVALSDVVDDVRWNAALALARRRDPAAVPTLIQMTDRDRLGQVKDLGADQKEEVILQAVSAAAAISDPSLRTALETLRDRDPSLKVRQAARVALAAQRP